MGRLALFSATACGTAVLSGCAVGDLSEVVELAGPNPAAAMTQLVGWARQGHGASFEFTMTGPGGMSMSGHGAYSTAPKPAMEEVADFGAVGGSSPMKAEMRLVDGTFYMRMSGQDWPAGDKWLRTTAPTQSGSDADSRSRQLEQMDPRKQLQDLVSARDLQRVGLETVDGVPAMHYSGDVPLPDFPNQGDSDAQTQADLKNLKKELTKVFGTTTHVDVWVDSKFRPRKYNTGLNTPLGTIASSMTFTGYDQPLTVTAPDPAEVIDLATQFQQLQEQLQQQQPGSPPPLSE